MKVKSQLVTQMSGSLGGFVGSHNAGGLYLRARSIPVNANTTAQQAARNAMTSVVSRWGQVLTAGQRAEWALYAQNTPLVDALGDQLVLSGQQMYVRCNSIRARVGLPLVDDGPTTFGQATLSDVTLGPASAATPGSAYTFNENDAWVDEDDAALIIQQGTPVSPAVNYFRGPFRQWAILEGDSVAPPTSPGGIVGVEFPIAVGQRLYARFRVSRADGRLSSPQTVSVLVTA